MVFDERRPSFDQGPFQSALDVVLRLRNRSSFSAEELQSCLDNLQELEVKTQSRILRKRMNYSDFFILVHSVMFGPTSGKT